MKFGPATVNARPKRDGAARTGRGRRPAACRASAFTLAEVLAALLFMAIVIPVAVEALHIASVSGQVAVRKAEAARIADNILNESVVTTNWSRPAGGTRIENGREFRWSLRTEFWSADPGLQLLTAEVAYSAQGRDYTVRAGTLINPLAAGALAGMP
jgi:hypothetical protein